jgi:ABC-type multidrug transport system ATPase subunit
VLLPGANGFVPQDDRLHGFYTVKSYMKHYSRLAGLKSSPELDKEIDDLISDLGLTDQAGTIVGDLFLKGLSGGQKRRLSIGLEALTAPTVSIIFDSICCTALHCTLVCFRCSLTNFPFEIRICFWTSPLLD